MDALRDMVIDFIERLNALIAAEDAAEDAAIIAALTAKVDALENALAQLIANGAIISEPDIIDNDNDTNTDDWKSIEELDFSI